MKSSASSASRSVWLANLVMPALFTSTSMLPNFFDGCFDKGAAVGIFGDVGFYGEGFDAEFLAFGNNFVGGVGAGIVVDADIDAAPGKADGGGSAEAGAAAGDDGFLAFHAVDVRHPGRTSLSFMRA